MNDTRNEILRLGEELIRTKGYHAFSYADIAEVVQIKKATIHYYFPSKADLGTEIIKNTIQHFHEAIKSWECYPHTTQLKKWVAIYDDSKKKSWVCLIGALAPTFDTLPASMQKELQRLSEQIFQWLENLLEKGKETGAFHFNETPLLKAYNIQSTLLASLLLDKVMKGKIYTALKHSILSI